MTLAEPAPPPSPADIRRLAARYRVLRSETRTYNSRAGKLVGRDRIGEAGRALGLMSDDTLVFPTEDAASVLFDFCHHCQWPDGSRVADRYPDVHPSAPGSDHAVVARAMRDARYRIVIIQGVVEGLGVQVSDPMREQSLLVADMGLAETGGSGGSIAGWLLETDEFAMTSGVALSGTREPLTAALKAFSMQYPEMSPAFFRDLDRARETKLATLVIRSLLASDQIDNVEFRDALAAGVAPRRWSGRRQDRSRRPARNAPCPCGSGKRYKSCCGKKARR